MDSFYYGYCTMDIRLGPHPFSGSRVFEDEGSVAWGATHMLYTTA